MDSTHAYAIRISRQKKTVYQIGNDIDLERCIWQTGSKEWK